MHLPKPIFSIFGWKKFLDKAFLHFLPNFCHFLKWNMLNTLDTLWNYEKSSKIVKIWQKKMKKIDVSFFIPHFSQKPKNGKKNKKRKFFVFGGSHSIDSAVIRENLVVWLWIWKIWMQMSSSQIIHKNCSQQLFLKVDTLQLGVKILNLKMDFNIYGTWRRVGQWALMMKIYDFFLFGKVVIKQ